jgi:hypothetical protein
MEEFNNINRIFDTSQNGEKREVNIKFYSLNLATSPIVSSKKLNHIKVPTYHFHTSLA